MELDFYISKNGRYMMLENVIYDKALNRSANINEICFSDLIDIVGENMTFLAQDVKADLTEISSFTRKNAYRVLECFDETDKKLSLMMEYEVKFGGSLLTESVVNPKVIVAETWAWIKEQALILEWDIWGGLKSAASWVGDKAKAVGRGVVDAAKSVGRGVVNVAKGVGNFIAHPIDSLKAGWDWVKTHSFSSVMESVRDALYSGIGTAVQLFLQFIPVVGNAIVGVIWGIYLIYDLYQGIVHGKWDIMNILFDVLGIVSAGAVKLLKVALKGVNVAGKGMAATVETLAANPGTKGIMSTIASGFGKVLDIMKGGAKWLSEKLGLTWAVNLIGKAETFLSEKILKPIGNGLGLKNVGNKALSKATGAPTVGQAARQSTVTATKQLNVINPSLQSAADKGGELYNKAFAKAEKPVAAPASNTYGLSDELYAKYA